MQPYTCCLNLDKGTLFDFFVSIFVRFYNVYTPDYRLNRCVHMYFKELVYGSRFFYTASNDWDNDLKPNLRPKNPEI